eukprot:GHVT01011167.1.p1 GENE.GHVT01011167.1~~GHVT01011167.1.p1  ORF type:complete len:127 (+),score=17.53 GHVT01011167.1:664-1044(+)
MGRRICRKRKRQASTKAGQANPTASEAQNAHCVEWHGHHAPQSPGPGAKRYGRGVTTRAVERRSRACKKFLMAELMFLEINQRMGKISVSRNRRVKGFQRLQFNVLQQAEEEQKKLKNNFLKTKNI